ncbi:hypothetical protein GGF38_005579, partial [Coemansia sp. RSA 25]
MPAPATAVDMTTPVTSVNMPARSGVAINGGIAASQHVSSLPFGGPASMVDGGRRSSSMASSVQGSDARMMSSPSSGYGARVSASEGHASPSTHADNFGTFSGLLSAIDSGQDSGRDSGRDVGKDFGRDSGRDYGRDSGRDYGRDPGGATQPPQSKRLPAQYPDDFVPEIIRIYAQEFPVELSPNVLLKVMRGIYGSTRTSLINVDIELSWCMILKGILPRILLFSYIASMARGQVIDAELMLQLPAKFDEICYEYAVKDIPLALASPSLWSALSLHMIGRYEFQSARYDLMLQHYEMAADILAKTAFHGYPFPWTS